MLGECIGVVIGKIKGIDLLCSDGAFECGGRVLDENFSVIDDSDAVAQLVGLFHVVGGEDDGDAFFAEPAHGFPHGDAALWVEAGAGFVEEEDFGSMRDSAGDLDTLRQAARELGGIGVSAFGEVELLEELHCALLCCGSRESEVETVEVNVLVDGAGAVERVVLGHNAHGAAGERGRCDDVSSGDEDLAGGGECPSGADADGGCFTGSVWAKKSVQLALADAEFDIVDRHDTLFSLVDLTKAFDLDNCSQTYPIQCFLLSVARL